MIDISVGLVRYGYVVVVFPSD